MTKRFVFYDDPTQDFITLCDTTRPHWVYPGTPIVRARPCLAELILGLLQEFPVDVDRAIKIDNGKVANLRAETNPEGPQG